MNQNTTEESTVIVETDEADAPVNSDVSAVFYPPPYKVLCNCLFIETYKGKDKFTRKLCNFTPYLVAEVTHDDGATLSKSLRIKGVHESGMNLPEIEVPVEELQAMSWVLKNWGTKCNIEPTNNTKELIRHAIQSTAEKIEYDNVYGQTGWRLIGGEYVFLMPSDDETVNVQLDGELAHYWFNNTCTDDDLYSVYLLLFEDFTPDKIRFPLLAFSFLTPLNYFLKKAACEPKFVLAVTGRTGARKSTISALFLSFFGVFTNSDLPLSFRDTAKSILHNLYTLKDVLTVIDDFHPSGKTDDVDMTKAAQMIMRAYGDRTGRGKLSSNSQLMNSRPPTGNAIITAEFPPDITASGTSRYLNVELKENDINLDELTFFQGLAFKGSFCAVMKAYIDWIKATHLSSEENKKEFVATFANDFKTYRTSFFRELAERKIQCHPRIPEAISQLKIGFYMLLSFFKNNNLLLDSDENNFKISFEEVLIQLAIAQADSVNRDKPTEKFISKFISLLNSGRCYVERKGCYFESRGIGFVGFEDDTFYYLITDIAHALVKRLCDEQGESFPISVRELLKQLDDESFIEVAKKSRTKSYRDNDKVLKVMYLRKGKVDGVIGVSNSNSE